MGIIIYYRVDDISGGIMWRNMKFGMMKITSLLVILVVVLMIAGTLGAVYPKTAEASEKQTEPQKAWPVLYPVDSDGYINYTFDLYDSIFVYGEDFTQCAHYDIYVTTEYGGPLIDVSGGAENVTTNMYGYIEDTLIWDFVQTTGWFYLVADDGDGILNENDIYEYFEILDIIDEPRIIPANASVASLEFTENDTVYVFGEGFLGYEYETVDIYVVEYHDVWDEGLNLTDSSVSLVENIIPDADGNISSEVWSCASSGRYNIVVDTNQDGAYDYSDILSRDIIVILPQIQIRDLNDTYVDIGEDRYAILSAPVRNYRLNSDAAEQLSGNGGWANVNYSETGVKQWQEIISWDDVWKRMGKNASEYLPGYLFWVDIMVYKNPEYNYTYPLRLHIYPPDETGKAPNWSASPRSGTLVWPNDILNGTSWLAFNFAEKYEGNGPAPWVHSYIVVESYDPYGWYYSSADTSPGNSSIGTNKDFTFICRYDEPEIQFKYDISEMREYLLTKGYNDSNIYAYTIPYKITNFPWRIPDYTYNRQALPYDFNEAWIDGHATHINLRNALDIVTGNATDKDFVLIEMRDHGGHRADSANFGTYSDPTYEIWNSNNYWYDYQFAPKLNKIKAKTAVIVDTCHSGGFINLSKGYNRLIVTSCRWDEGSWRRAYRLYERIQDQNADLNSDGFISIEEAHNYAASQLPVGCTQTPQMDDQLDSRYHSYLQLACNKTGTYYDYFSDEYICVGTPPNMTFYIAPPSIYLQLKSKGTAYPSKGNARIYVVNHKKYWYHNNSLKDASAGYENVKPSAGGDISLTGVWLGASTSGSYDVIVDYGPNDGGKYGVYDKGLDLIDNSTAVGFTVNTIYTYLGLNRFLRNNATIIYVTSWDNPGYGVSADFSSVDSNYEPGNVTVIDNEEGTYTIMYNISENNILENAADIPINITITNADGYSSYDNLTVTLDNTPPVCEIVSPDNNWVISSTINIVAETGATDTYSTLFEYSSDEVNWSIIGYDYTGSDGWSASWNTNRIDDGDYFLRATMMDYAGNTGEDTISIEVNNTLPTITITEPLDNATVNSTITISVASDSNISSVVFEYSYDYMNWTRIGTDSDGSDGWSITWDTTTVDNGNYLIGVMMTDSRGLMGSDVIGVTVNNLRVSRPPIYIDSNSGFNETNGVSSGSGAQADPYIIENWDINASTAHGIYIENTKVYFIIRNCVIHDGYDPDAPLFMNEGIHLYNVTHGQIENVSSYDNFRGISVDLFSNAIIITKCTTYNNFMEGIMLYSSNNTVTNCVIYNNSDGIYVSGYPNNKITNCRNYNNSRSGLYIMGSSDNIIMDSLFFNNSCGIVISASNNKITNCTIYDNIGPSPFGGIYIYHSANANQITYCNITDNIGYGVFIEYNGDYPSDSNLFHHNNFINNSQNTYDPHINYWNTTTEGNYWSDYDEPSEGAYDNNTNGIVDSPYAIPGGSNADNYPFMTPRGWEQVTGPVHNIDKDTYYNTIQEAIDDANSGDTIEVSNGTYYENVIINKTITLIGEDRNNTIIDGSGAGDVIYISADWVNVSGFRVMNGNFSGIYLHYSSNNQITNCTMYNNSLGIYLLYSSNTNITKCWVYNNSVGIHFWGSSNNNITNCQIYNNYEGIPFTNSPNNNMVNCQIYNNCKGIFLYFSSNNILRDNVLGNNTYNFGVYGQDIFHFYQDINTSNTINSKPIYYIIEKSNLIFDEHVSIGYLGLVSCSNIIVKDLNFTNNIQGLLMSNTTDSTISNCQIYNNIYYGIALYSSSNNNVINCQIYNNCYGIYSDYSSNNNTINVCNIYNNSDMGIYSIYSSNSEVHYCNIYNNTNYGIYNYESESQFEINATYNWWSNATGPCHSTNPNGTGDSVSDNVIYDSWLSASYGANHPPTVSNLTLTPSSPKTTDSLTANYDYHDIDNDTQNGTEIRWYKNGVLQAEFDNKTTIPSSATSQGETWYFTVKPKDGIDFGDVVTSASVTIQNSPPTATDLSLSPLLPYTTDNLTANYTYHDDDNDTQNGTEIRWYKNGVLQSEYNNETTVPSSATSQGETWNFTVKPKDGKDFGELQESSNVTIQNSPPVVDAGKNQTVNEGATVQFNGSATDPDNDNLTITWDFDDGNKTNNTLTPTHVYGDNGVYNVTLTVDDGKGGVSYDNLTVTVDNVKPNVSAIMKAWGNKTLEEKNVTVRLWINYSIIVLNLTNKTNVTIVIKYIDCQNGTVAEASPNGTIKIDTCDLNRTDLNYTYWKETIFHEMRHLWQYYWEKQYKNNADTHFNNIKNDNVTVNDPPNATTTSYNDWMKWVKNNYPPRRSMSKKQHEILKKVWENRMTDYWIAQNGGSTNDFDGDSDWDADDWSIYENLSYEKDANDWAAKMLKKNKKPTEGDPYFEGYFTDPGFLDTHTIEWDFGDGSNATGTLTPMHDYGENGTYNVTLTVTDDDGDVGTDTIVIIIYNVAPDVDAGLDQTVYEGANVQFNGNYIDPGFLDTHTIEWDFGDGNKITGTLTPAHVYGAPGTYNVTLTVTDDDGGIGYDNLTVTVLILPYQEETETINGHEIMITYSGVAPINLSAAEAPSAPPEDMDDIDIFVNVETTGTICNIHISIRYNESDLPKGVSEKSLMMYYWTGTEWKTCNNTGVDTVNNIVWANVSHLTIFAPMAKKTAGPIEEGINWLVYTGIGIMAVVIIITASMLILKRKKK